MSVMDQCSADGFCEIDNVPVTASADLARALLASREIERRRRNLDYAAADLLAACQAYVAAYDAGTGTIHVNDQIRAAIAKALPTSEEAGA